LETYRALVERVSRQVAVGRDHVQKLETQTKTYLKAGERDAAAKFALELQKAKKDLAANEQQLAMHEEAYGNNLKKIQHATKKLSDVREKIQKYDAELKMSSAEAEVAKLAQSFNMDITTDFGKIEEVIQGKIDKNRAKVRVAADLSQEGIESIQAEERVEKAMAEDALTQFEAELGLRSPETTKLADATKDLGPAVTDEKATQTSH
jgi:phage shock protein A